MYEAVHAYPAGEATVARHAQTAARYGYDGIVVRTRAAVDVNEPDASGNTDGTIAPGGGSLTVLRANADIDVVDAIEIDAAETSAAGSAIGSHRSQRTVICVVGGDDQINRFAVEDARVDVLVRPMQDGGDFNHVLAKAARDNHVHVEFDFGPVLRTSGGDRVRALSDLRKLREIVTYYDAPHVVSANVASHLSLRAPRELVAVGEAAGFDPDWMRAGLQAWGDIVDRNRKRRAEEFIAPGVRRGTYETNR